MENPPNKFTFSLGAKKFQKNTKKKQENNHMNKCTKKPMENPMQSPPNKFTIALRAEKKRTKGTRKTQWKTLQTSLLFTWGEKLKKNMNTSTKKP